MAVPTSMSQLGVTDGTNSPVGTEIVGSNLDNYIRANAAITRRESAKGVDKVAAATISLTDDGNYFSITGSTTISAIATAWIGRQVYFKFSDSPLLIHNPTSFILPGGANIQVAPDDTAVFIEESTGNWRCLHISTPRSQIKNVIWNGAMDVWQGGTSATGITLATNSSDGFRFDITSQGTWTIDRSATVPTVAQAGRNINFSTRFLVTTADATTAAGDLAFFQYSVEGFDYQELYQQPQHLSFWAKSTTTGTYCVAFRNSGFDRSFVFTFTINAANTWELKQFSLTAVPSGGTWNFQTGVGINIVFTFAAGTTFQTTANAWQTGNFIATSAQTNLAAAINNDFFIADVRLHGGASRSPVIVPTFTETLQLAQRRFFKSFPYDTAPAQNTGGTGSFRALSVGTAANSLTYAWRYPTYMRITPTVTTFNPGALNDNWTDGVNSRPVILHDSGNTGVNIANSGIILADATHIIHAMADARF